MSPREFALVAEQLSEYLGTHALEAELEDLFHLFVEDLGRCPHDDIREPDESFHYGRGFAPATKEAA